MVLVGLMVILAGILLGGYACALVFYFFNGNNRLAQKENDKKFTVESVRLTSPDGEVRYLSSKEIKEMDIKVSQ